MDHEDLPAALVRHYAGGAVSCFRDDANGGAITTPAGGA